MNRPFGSHARTRGFAPIVGALPLLLGLLSRRRLGDVIGVVFTLLLPISLPRRFLALAVIQVATRIGRRILRRSGSPTAQFLDSLLASGQRLR